MKDSAALRAAAEGFAEAAGTGQRSQLTPEGVRLLAEVLAHAAVLAAEDEARAARVSDECHTYIQPKYDPLVSLLLNVADRFAELRNINEIGAVTR